MISFVALVVTALLLPLAAQTATETDTGSNIPIPLRARIPEGAYNDVDSARITAASFARCVVARNGRGVARAIDLPDGPVASKAMASLATSECLDSGQMTIPRRLMRGSLFVELYRTRESKKIDIATPRPIDLSDQSNPEFKQDPVRHAILSFGDCVVKRDLQDSRNIILSPTASAAQNAAFKQLIPNLGPCLAEGQKIAFSKPVIEGILAEVLYRGTVEPVAATENK